MEYVWAVQILNSILIVLMLGFFGMVVYLVYLSIKALRIYIRKEELKFKHHGKLEEKKCEPEDGSPK